MEHRSERKGIPPRIIPLHSPQPVRCRNAKHLEASLTHLNNEWGLPFILVGNVEVWDAYHIIVDPVKFNRDALADHLGLRGITTKPVAACGLLLPCHEGLEPMDIEYILQEILLWLMIQ